jgi:peptidoglycan/xylan/chitin deacetylase (PgdA/CDA1 family)
MSNYGRFVISLDTELSWGSFDTSGIRHYEQAYRNTREVIDGLCDLFDTYEAPVTWALVMHLLDDCDCHSDLTSPSYDWVDWFSAIPCATDVNRQLWYAEVEHEIGLHGYTHLILGAEGCTRDAAESEVETALAVANRAGIDPDTYVFPRNEIGHLDVLRKNDIRFYRGVDARWYEQRLPNTLRRPLRFADEVLKSTPPVVVPNERDGLVELPGSQILRPFTGPWKYTQSNTQIKRAKSGLDKAARTGEVFHLWFHPFNLGISPDRHLNVIEEILSYAAELRDQGEIEICTIADAVQGSSRI